jgi:hypothetical protein
MASNILPVNGNDDFCGRLTVLVLDCSSHLAELSQRGKRAPEQPETQTQCQQCILPHGYLSLFFYRSRSKDGGRFAGVIQASGTGF